MNNQQAVVANAMPPVCMAARSGNVSTLRELLNGGASVNAADPQSEYRPLQFAAWGGHVACIALILEQAGVDVNESVGRPFGFSGTTPQFGPMTALHLAAQCRRNTADLCRLLIDKGADINSREAFLDRKPLHFACEHADAEVIKLLVNEETFTHFLVDKHFNAVLPHTIAINNRNAVALDALLQFESQCSIKLSASHKSKLVYGAAGPRTGEILFEKLYENYADTITASANSTQLLLVAIGNAERVKYFLDKGCIPKANNSDQCAVLLSLLTQATVSLPEDVLDLLLGHITPFSVDLLNGDTHVNQNHPLIETYFRRRQVESFVQRYAKLLTLGLDPKRAIAQRAWMVDHSIRLYAENGSVLMMTNLPFSFLSHHCDNMLFHHRQFSGSFSALTSPIFTIFNQPSVVGMVPEIGPEIGFEMEPEMGPEIGPERVPEMVRLLLNHSASPNASLQNELSPLLALVWRANRQNFSEGDPLREVFDLQVEAGVKFDECSDNSPFVSPDIAVAAACTGNEIVLQHCLENSDTDPLTLFGDLMKLEFTYHDINNRNEHTIRQKLRTNIGFSVRALLPFTDVRVVDLMNQVHDRYTDSIPPLPPHTLENTNNDDRETTIWREVTQLVNRTSRLKHICRVTIRVSLLTAGKRNLRAGIASLDIPTRIREYLTFQTN